MIYNYSGIPDAEAEGSIATGSSVTRGETERMDDDKDPLELDNTALDGRSFGGDLACRGSDEPSGASSKRNHSSGRRLRRRSHQDHQRPSLVEGQYGS